MVVAKAIVREDRETAKSGRSSPSVHQAALPFRTYLLVMGSCFLLFGANAILHAFVASSSARIDTLTKELVVAENETRETELEIARLSSYPRIAREAVRRLAMHAPGPGELRFVAISLPAPSVETNPYHPERAGLVATVGDWLRTLGRAEASTH